MRQLAPLAGSSRNCVAQWHPQQWLLEAGTVTLQFEHRHMHLCSLPICGQAVMTAQVPCPFIL